jgi:tRNA (mo5U34)-methyltransferase
MGEAAFMTRPSRPASGLAEAAAELAPWFHNLHLPDGSQTAPDHPLGDFPAFKWRDISRTLPADLTGWTALDIGCNSGFYSIELAKRGAHVTAVDKDPHFLRQAKWAVEQFKLEDRVTVVEAQVYDLAAWNRRFDLILFLGVFYHLRYPLLGLDIVAEKVDRLMVFQTLTMPGTEQVQAPDNLDMNDRERMLEPGWPKMAFIEKELAGDPTNWWAPNHAAVVAMLSTTGLRVVEQPAHEIYVCEPVARTPEAGRTYDPDELRAATGRLKPAAIPGRVGYAQSEDVKSP